MNKNHTLLYYLTRTIGVLSILFISSFALDVFNENTAWVDALLGFMLHLMPSIMLVAILSIAWWFERLGGVLFILISLIPFFLLSNDWWVNVLLATPFLLTGLLFLIHDWVQNKRRPDDINN